MKHLNTCRKTGISILIINTLFGVYSYKPRSNPKTMLITMNCHVSVNTSAVNEDIEVEVPDDFFDWHEQKQYAYLAEDFDSWLGSNSDSGYGFKKAE